MPKRQPLFKMTPQLLDERRDAMVRKAGRGEELDAWEAATLRPASPHGPEARLTVQIFRLALTALRREGQGAFEGLPGPPTAYSALDLFLDALEVGRVTDNFKRREQGGFTPAPLRMAPVHPFGQAGRPKEPAVETATRVLFVDSLCELTHVTTPLAIKFWNGLFAELAYGGQAPDVAFRNERTRIREYMARVFPEPEPAPKRGRGRPPTRLRTLIQKGLLGASLRKPPKLI